jgi:hypothetical protein
VSKKKEELSAEQISAALRSRRGEFGIVVNDLQAELAATMHALLPTAKADAKKGKPALLRLITRYATNRFLLARPK